MRTCSVTGCLNIVTFGHLTRCARHIEAHRARWTDDRVWYDRDDNPTGRTPRHRATT